MCNISCDIVISYHPATLQWVSAAIDSALNQQHANCFVHVIADAVPHEDDLCIRDKFKDAENISFYRNEQSLGPYHSLHSIFRYLKTDYIAIQDSDDISLPHRIWFSITELHNHNCAIFGGTMENFLDWRTRTDDLPKTKQCTAGVVVKSGFVSESYPHGWLINATMVLKKDTFMELNGFTDMFRGADAEFIERASCAGIAMHISDAVVILRRIHTSSLTSDKKIGLDTAYAQLQKKHLLQTYQRFVPGFDPKEFGCLDKWLGYDAHGESCVDAGASLPSRKNDIAAYNPTPYRVYMKMTDGYQTASYPVPPST